MKKYITKMDKFKKFFTRRLDRKQSKRLVKNPFVVLRILLITPKFPIKKIWRKDKPIFRQIILVNKE